jgi:AraC-like DNA-binding protein
MLRVRRRVGVDLREGAVMADDRVVQPVQRVEFAARDQAATEEFIRQMYVGNRLRFRAVPADAKFAATVAVTPGIAADRIRSTVDHTTATDPFDYLFFFFVDQGGLSISSAGDETVVLPGEGCCYPVGVPLEVDTVDIGLRSLRLPVQRLAAVAQETAGTGTARLRFEGTRPVSPALARHWSSVFDLVHGALMAEDSPLQYPLLADGLVQMVALSALHAFPNTTMTGECGPGPGQVAPAAVRRAAAYIEENADQPVAVSDIATAAGTSALALRDAFAGQLGTTPAGYLRRVRLEHAHRELQAADPLAETVRRVAARWGFASLERFTLAYRQAFRRSPGTTLRA